MVDMFICWLIVASSNHVGGHFNKDWLECLHIFQSHDSLFAADDWHLMVLSTSFHLKSTFAVMMLISKKAVGVMYLHYNACLLWMSQAEWQILVVLLPGHWQ